MSNGSSPHDDRHPAHHEDPVGGKDDFVGAGDLADQEVADSARREDVGQALPNAAAGQSQQPAGLVVDQRDAPVDIGRDRTFTDAVKTGLTRFQQTRDLARLQSKSLPLQPQCQQERTSDAEGEGNQQIEGKLRKHRRELLRKRTFKEADRHDPDDTVLSVEDGCLSARRYAERAMFHPNPGMSGKDGTVVFVDRFPVDARGKIDRRALQRLASAAGEE